MLKCQLTLQLYLFCDEKCAFYLFSLASYHHQIIIIIIIIIIITAVSVPPFVCTESPSVLLGRERRWAEIQCNTLWSVTQIQCNTMWHTVTLLDATYCVPIHYTPLLHSVILQPKSMLPFTNVGIGNRANSQYLDWWCYPTIWTRNPNPFCNILQKFHIFYHNISLMCNICPQRVNWVKRLFMPVLHESVVVLELLSKISVLCLLLSPREKGINGPH